MNRSILLGMTTGAAITLGFGIVWLLVGLLLGGPSPVWLRLSLLFAGIVLGSSIATLGLRASRLSRDTVPLTAEQVATNRAMGRRFGLVSGIETTAIVLALVVLNVVHYPGYISCAIAVIVGVHFFALAPLFRAPAYHVTGFLGCAIALVGVFVADAVLRQKVVGLSFGLLLWATAAWVAWKGLSAVPRVTSNLPPT